MADTRATMREYADGYDSSAKTIDISALPLVGLAAAAAAALFYDASTDLVAGIGIGAATYAAGRAVLIPEALPQIYIDGYTAASCLLDQSGVFVGDTSERRAILFSEQTEDLRRLVRIGRAALARARVPAPALRERFQTALSQLTQTIAAAEQVLATASTELRARDAAEHSLGQALAKIRARVASRARSGRAVNFGQTRAAITGVASELLEPAPADDALAAERLDRALDEEEELGGLQRLTGDIAIETARLTANMPGYVEALEAATECPEIAG